MELPLESYRQLLAALVDQLGLDAPEPPTSWSGRARAWLATFRPSVPRGGRLNRFDRLWETSLIVLFLAVSTLVFLDAFGPALQWSLYVVVVVAWSLVVLAVRRVWTVVIRRPRRAP